MRLLAHEPDQVHAGLPHLEPACVFCVDWMDGMGDFGECFVCIIWITYLRRRQGLGRRLLGRSPSLDYSWVGWGLRGSRLDTCVCRQQPIETQPAIDAAANHWIDRWGKPTAPPFPPFFIPTTIMPLPPCTRSVTRMGGPTPIGTSRVSSGPAGSDEPDAAASKGTTTEGGGRAWPAGFGG